jgi:hypothetical protein
MGKVEDAMKDPHHDHAMQICDKYRNPDVDEAGRYVYVRPHSCQCIGMGTCGFCNKPPKDPPKIGLVTCPDCKERFTSYGTLTAHHKKAHKLAHFKIQKTLKNKPKHSEPPDMNSRWCSDATRTMIQITCSCCLFAVMSCGKRVHDASQAREEKYFDEHYGARAEQTKAKKERGARRKRELKAWFVRTTTIGDESIKTGNGAVHYKTEKKIHVAGRKPKIAHLHEKGAGKGATAAMEL